MRLKSLAWTLAAVTVLGTGAWGGTRPGAEPEVLPKTEATRPILVADDALQAAAPSAKPAGEPAAPAVDLGRSPIPFQTIEGYGGTSIAPMAYLLNPGKPGETAGRPTFSYSYSRAGDKDLHVFAAAVTFFRRIELSYAANRAGFDDLAKDVRMLTGGLERVTRDDVWLHHINLRGLLVEEDSHDLPLPAVTGGVHFKINQGIHSIDHDLNRPFGRGLSGVGFERASGVDFTLTGSKTFPTLAGGRPLIATAGLRWSQASQIGWAGFSDTYRVSWEGSLVCLLRDDLAAGYEYRMRRTAYDRRLSLSEGEDDWHLLFVAWAIDEHLKVIGRWMYAGELANSDESCVWGIQIQYDF